MPHAANVPLRIAIATIALLSCGAVASAERREGQFVVYQIDALDGRSSSLGYQLREAGREELTELSFDVAPAMRSGDHIVVDGTVGADGRLHVDHAETVTDTSA